MNSKAGDSSRVDSGESGEQRKMLARVFHDINTGKQIVAYKSIPQYNGSCQIEKLKNASVVTC